MKYLGRFICVFLLFLFFMQGCKSSGEEAASRLKTVIIHSKVLGKDMKSKVYLPEDYVSGNKYPVLYFIHDGGGSADTVISQYEITEKADAMVKKNKIRPMLIVALRIDQSFGINSAKETNQIKLQSGKEFDQGMYEDYIIKEAIPFIDSQFNTVSNKEGRYIGGYSMGGFAALYIAFRYNEMFSKAGGHSPSLFLDDFPDKYITDWLYPNQQIRKGRDPLYIAQDKDLSSLSVYLDTGETDENVEGCQKLYDILQDKGVKSEYHLFFGSHSRTYCNNYMDKYLLFYGSD